jgi:putative chitinase
VITLEDLKRICVHTKYSRLDKFVEPLNVAMAEFDINNVARETAFLAQAAHESGGFNYMREIATGEAYEGRKDLGNDEPGEGVRFKGRGIFQLTGDTNYRLAGTEIWGDPDWLTYNPQFAEEPMNACRIAGWFWKRNGLNQKADVGDFRGITKRINGGYNGWADRMAYFELAQKVLA